MIINVKKYLFYGLAKDLDGFFSEAQKLGLIEFLPSSGKKPLNLPKSAEHLLSALKILKKQVRPQEKDYVKEGDPVEIADRTIFLKNSIEKNHEKQRLLKYEMAKVSVFGDFSLLEFKKIEKETGVKAKFFTSKISKREQIKLPEYFIYIGSDLSLDYFISLSQKDELHKDFLEVKIDKPIGDLKREFETLTNRIAADTKELLELVYYQDLLKETLIKELNHYHLRFSKDEVLYHLDDNIFSVQAWIPTKYVSKVEKLLKEFCIQKMPIAIDKDDRVPTCMENKKLHHVGEDLVKIYDIPSPTDRDPSGFVIAAFSVFFAMIVADAGYGMIYFLASLFGYFKLKFRSAASKRMMKLFLLISSCCVVWGVFIGSFFGIQMKPTNPLQKASVLQSLAIQKAKYHMKAKDGVYQEWVDKLKSVSEAKTPVEFLLSVKKKTGETISYEILDEFNDNILIEIALLVGVLHICLSLLRYLPRNWPAFGWVLFILGGYFYFPSMLKATSILHFTNLLTKKFTTEFGLQLLCVGIVLAWVLSFIQNKKKGFEEPLQAIQVFADILSYLRLYALALAGMIMASTFNQIGRDVGFALGSIVIIIGHATNMVLGIMGGFIHGLRLNFLEWYHYCFEGGGKLFNPLKTLK